jgi:hypothetical protein
MSVCSLVTIIPNDRGERSKLGQLIILTKTLFFEYFNWINFKLGVKVAHGLPLSWLVLGADRQWASWLAPGSKMVHPKGKTLDEHFSDQLKFGHYDVISWHNDVNSFLKRNKMHLFTLQSMHAQMQRPDSMYARMGYLSQFMPKCEEGFSKILLAFWAT